jgi:glutathione synthase
MAQGLSLLFIVDPLDDLKAYKDTSIAMMREAARRGHDIWACEAAALRWRDGKVRALCQLLDLLPGDAPWYAVREDGSHELAQFDAVLMRKDPPFDAEYLYATHLLEAAQRGGARVFNEPRALRDHNEKLAITEFPEFVVPTLVTREPDALREFHAEFGDIVVKPLDGMGGTSVFPPAPGRPESQRDHRDDHAAGHAHRDGAALHSADQRRRQARAADRRRSRCRTCWRASPSRARRAATSPPAAPAWRSHCPTPTARSPSIWAPCLPARGLLLVGVDVIGQYLTEVNVTSPTCFVEITEQTGFDVAAMFTDALEAAVAKEPACIATAPVP